MVYTGPWHIAGCLPGQQATSRKQQALDKTGFRDYKGCRKDKLLWKKKKQLN